MAVQYLKDVKYKEFNPVDFGWASGFLESRGVKLWKEWNINFSKVVSPTRVTPQLSDMQSVHSITRKTILHTAVRTFFKYRYISVVIKIQPIFNSQRNVNMMQVLTFHILLKASSSFTLEIKGSQRISIYLFGPHPKFRGQIFKGILVGTEYPS